MDNGGKYQYIREDYAVREIYVREIEQKFQVRAERDCFANVQNARCEKFFRREEDALQRDWGVGETLWVNPPWTLWPRVVKKIQDSNCRAICICPDWKKGG